MPISLTDIQQLQREADAMRAVLDDMGAYIFIKDANGCYTYANPPVLALFGLALEQVLGKDDSHFFDLGVSNELRVNDLRVLQQGEIIEREETNLIKASGETRIFWSIKKPLRNSQGEIIGICGISTDITERKLLETQLREQKQLLDTVMNNVDAHIYMKDKHRRFLFANRKTAELFGQSTESIVGKRDTEVMAAENAERFWQMDAEVLRTQQKQEAEESFKDAQGNIRHYWTVKIPLQSVNGTDSLIGLSTDITELYKIKQELQRQASTDALTGLHNRRSFYDYAQREFSRSIRSRLPLSVIAIDIDFFKSVNDRYGHPVGDAVLCAVSQRLLETVRDADLLARTGGEEFSLILPETPLHTAMDVAERLRLLLEGYDLQVPGESITVTISLGVAMRTINEKSFDSLFSRADKALYQAKQQGRNQVCGAQ